MAESRIVGAMIKAYRDIMCYNLDDISEQCGIYRSVLTKLEASVFAYKVEDRQRQVSSDICQTLAKCMGMKLSEFLSIVESIEQEKNTDFILLVYFKLSEFYLKRKQR